MRNKLLVEKKIERIESLIKRVGFHVHREERSLAYPAIDAIIERIAEIKTLLSTETQD